MNTVVVLRPQPGAEATRVRAEGMGLQVAVAPLFTVVPIAWTPADPAAHDAVMLTSAQAVRHGGAQLALYRSLPVYAVGEATAASAMEVGFADVRTGSGNAEDLMRIMAEEGVERPLHLAGREHRSADMFPIKRLIVYAAEAAERLPAAARDAVQANAVALLHSPRAAALFARLLAAEKIAPQRVRIAAISPAAAGGKWGVRTIADRPTDAALLAAAARLCEKG